jgi:hypothetical protein
MDRLFVSIVAARAHRNPHYSPINTTKSTKKDRDAPQPTRKRTPTTTSGMTTDAYFIIWRPLRTHADSTRGRDQ